MNLVMLMLCVCDIVIIMWLLLLGLMFFWWLVMNVGLIRLSLRLIIYGLFLCLVVRMVILVMCCCWYYVCSCCGVFGVVCKRGWFGLLLFWLIMMYIWWGLILGCMCGYWLIGF